MRMRNIIAGRALCAALAVAASAPCHAAGAQHAAATNAPSAARNTAEALLAKSAAVAALRCEVRREIDAPDGSTMRVLSRVLFKRPNLLSVETASPETRRVVCDGAAYHTRRGAGKWEKAAFADLPEPRKAELRRLPGTVEDELSLFAGKVEKALPPAEGFAKRAGYEIAGGGVAVLSLDAEGRLARMEAFEDAAMSKMLSRTDFSHFMEIMPGVWLARLHVSEIRLGGRGGGTVFTTTRFGNIVANEEPPAGAFDAPDGARKAAKTRGAADWGAPGGGALFGGAWEAGAKSAGGGRGFLAAAFMLPARLVIGFYRSQISPAIGARCRVSPSCSEYFMRAARRHGPLALPMIADRLVREPEIHAKRALPLRQRDGRVLWGDPLADHDWWFAR